MMNTESRTITSTPVYPLALRVEGPLYGRIGVKTLEPFTLHLSSYIPGPYDVDIYAEYSKSSPLIEDTNKWSHLSPQWRFLDIDENVIESLVIDDYLPQTNSSGEVIGYVASAQFYYVDDLSAGIDDVILLWGVLDVSEYEAYVDLEQFDYDSVDDMKSCGNSKVAFVLPFLNIGIEPSRLCITRDGENDLFGEYWTNTTIPNIITVQGADDYVWGERAPILFNVPTTNDYGVQGGVVSRGVLNISESSHVWEPASETSGPYLSAVDYDSFVVGGYLANSVKITESTENAVISAGVTVYYEPVVGLTPNTWISNTKGSSLSRVQYLAIPQHILSEVGNTFDNLNLGGVFSNVCNVPIVETFDNDTGMVAGESGIIGVATDQYGSVWTADTDNGKLYKFDSVGSLVSTVDCFGEHPLGVSLDRNSDVLVTFYNTPAVGRFNGESGALDLMISQEGVVPPYTNPTHSPIMAQSDLNDDIWVTCNNEESSMITKYDYDGNYLGKIEFPHVYACPVDMVITNDYLWVACAYNVADRSTGSIYKYDISNGIPTTHIYSKSIGVPTHVTSDLHGGVYCTTGWNTLTHIPSVGSPLSVTTNSYGSSKPAWEHTNETAWGGIGVDVDGNIFAINSVENKLYVVDYATNTEMDSAFILPINNNKITTIIDGVQVEIDDPTADPSGSAVALGDFTGVEWLLKYSTSFVPNGGGIQSKYLEGFSDPIKIKDFKDFNIRRHNESADIVDNMKSNVFVGHIKDNPVLFDKILASTFSTISSEDGKAFGRQAYEKIANFVDNHVDADVCGIAQLYSLADEFDVPIDNYYLNFPPRLGRYMDIFSVNHQKLWGSRCGCNRNIENTYMCVLTGENSIYNNTDVLHAEDGRAYFQVKADCAICGHEHPGNRGDGFCPLTYEVSANIPFVVEDRYADKDKFDLIYPPVSSSGGIRERGDICVASSVIPDIDTMNYMLTDGLGIVFPSLNLSITDLNTRYCFYSYVDVGCMTQVEGVIDWDNRFTTLNESQSGIEDWYGDSGGYVEEIINYILHDGLGLVDE